MDEGSCFVVILGVFATFSSCFVHLAAMRSCVLQSSYWLWHEDRQQRANNKKNNIRRPLHVWVNCHGVWLMSMLANFCSPGVSRFLVSQEVIDRLTSFFSNRPFLFRGIMQVCCTTALSMSRIIAIPVQFFYGLIIIIIAIFAHLPQWSKLKPVPLFV